jgi:hypothetical protein
LTIVSTINKHEKCPGRLRCSGGNVTWMSVQIAEQEGKRLSCSKGYCQVFREGGAVRAIGVKQKSGVAVRPEGANPQWRKNPPGELPIDPVADERLVRVTAWVGAS